MNCIEAMRQSGQDMSEKYKETSLYLQEGLDAGVRPVW